MNSKLAKRLVASLFSGVSGSSSWRNQAACGQQSAGPDWDPELFWPEFMDNESVKQAKAVCRSCPVRPECLLEVLSMPVDPGGVWGGTTARMRGELRIKVRSASTCQNCGRPCKRTSKEPPGRVATYCTRSCRIEFEGKRRSLVNSRS